MRTLIVNFKNYPAVLGEGSVRLAQAVQAATGSTKIDSIVAPPTPMISLVASKVRIPVYGQTVGSETGDRTTGALLPEAIRAAGATGTILNHSESRKPLSELKKLVPRTKAAGLRVCLCAGTTVEAVKLSSLEPDYLAVEPPGLIGSGVAVSKAKPGLVKDSVSALRKTGYEGRILCGAGIVTGSDVRKAVELGAEGVLVASSVVGAKDWESKVRELAHSLM